MTGPMPITPDDAEFQKWKAARAAPQTHDDAEFQAWKAKQGGGLQDISAQLQQQVDARQKAAAAAPEPFMTKVAREAVNVGQGIPGVKALESYELSKLQGIPYSQAVPRVSAMTQDLPTSHKIIGQMIGGAPLAALVPGSPAVAGALIGGAHEALAAEPQSMTERGVRTALGAGVGAATGKLADMAVTKVRSALTPSLGAQQEARTAIMSDADRVLYGSAKQQADALAANGPTSSKLVEALNDPDIKPYADMVRGARQFRGLPDEQVALETFKQMGAEQGGLLQRLEMHGYDAKLALKAQDLGLAKDQLRNAISEVVPSFEPAVSGHATQAGELDAMQQGADALRRAGKSVAGSRLATQSPESFASDVAQMKPPEQEAAAQGVLGRLKEMPASKVHRVLGVPVFATPSRGLRQAPGLLRTIDAPSQSMADFLAKLGIVGAKGTVSGATGSP
jgi:hypothetical protein